jgi:uncharacterized protein YlaI
MAGLETGALELAEPGTVTRTRSGRDDPANDWLCAWCHNRVASEKDRFYYDGKSEFSFQNPERTRFDILTFSRTIGCAQAGLPTFEHTWFPGHAWSYCVCNWCRMHLGWHYAGPSIFTGLIRDRIVRALLIRS